MQRNRVLIVDDDPPIVELLRTYLEDWGYEVTSASSGDEAMTLYKERPFEIVLCDWEMPGMSGPNLCRRIREIESTYYTYIVLLTVKNATENVVTGIEAGADDYLTKPLSKPILKVRLEAGIRLLQLERSLAETNSRLTQGLNRAASTLRSLLPTPREGPTLAFDWIFDPCSYVGGDIFNVSMLDDDLFSLYIVDVSGHGFDSALSAVTIGNTLRPRNKIANPPGSGGTRQNYWIDSPVDVAAVLNERFPLEPPDNIYFTLFYGIFDRRDLTLRWVRAGHPPPLVLQGNTIIELEAGDPPIGFFEEHVFSEHSTQLHKGDRIFLYSDGITELNDGNFNMFGTARLHSAIRRNAPNALVETISDIDRALSEHSSGLKPPDDISLLALEIL